MDFRYNMKESIYFYLHKKGIMYNKRATCKNGGAL